MQKFYIKTFGCQMNVYDSERMCESLSAINFEHTDNMDDADAIILNTCHIREKASEKIYSELGYIRATKQERAKNGLNTVVIVAGCVAQAEGDEIQKRAPVVDIVIGSESYHHLPDLILASMRGEKSKSAKLDFTPQEKFDTLTSKRSSGNICSFVTVQEGCDKFCTFCVVPYTRGKEYSRPVSQIYDEVKSLVQNGMSDVTLLGQNVNAYHGLDGKDEKDLAYLISKISEIDHLERIRYVTSHPLNMNDELIAAHGSNPKLMPYLHLPVQSGSDKILRLMNRKHNRSEYFKIIEKFRKVRPDICLSSDFIVAFPGETDADFEDTMNLVREIKYAQSYSFKYSPRPGTPAAEKELVSDDIAQERLEKLQNLLADQSKEYNSKFQNVYMPVLIESTKHWRGRMQIAGKSPYLQAVSIESEDASLVGKIVNVKITKVMENSLVGELAI